MNPIEFSHPEVVVGGAGLVGLLTAVHLKRTLPELEIVVVGPRERKQPIVGESLVELSTHFIRDLGLGELLVDRHFPKYGLTYYYKIDADDPLDDTYYVSESPAIPPFPSFQINRFTFDRDLRDHAESLGIRFLDARITDVAAQRDIRGCLQVEAVGVGEAESTAESTKLYPRWFVDATGRRRLLARKFGLQREAKVQRSAFWFRLENFERRHLFDIDIRKRSNQSFDSYYCTHHFFGRGNWIWVIPMRSPDERDMVSVGIVYRPDLTDMCPTTIEDAVKCIGSQHPHLARLIESGKVVDTNVYRNYMHETHQRYSPEGWFLVGDAADAVDPLYSTGIALAAAQIRQISALVEAERRGEDIGAIAPLFDRAYESFYRISQDDVARLYPVMADPYQTSMRQHMAVAVVFHMIAPMLMNDYLSTKRGATLLAGLVDSKSITDGLTRFYELVERASGCVDHRDLTKYIEVQTSFVLNYDFFNSLCASKVAESATSMYVHAIGLRLKLMRQVGGRMWISRRQWGALASDGILGLVFRLFKGRDLLANPIVQSMARSRLRSLQKSRAGVFGGAETAETVETLEVLETTEGDRSNI